MLFLSSNQQKRFVTEALASLDKTLASHSLLSKEDRQVTDIPHKNHNLTAVLSGAQQKKGLESENKFDINSGCAKPIILCGAN